MEHGAAVSPAPGWRPDPTRRHQLRYWDGTNWTAHVATGGQQFLDPPTMPLPIDPVRSPAESVLSEPVGRGFLRRLLWSLYAIPATMLLLGVTYSALPAGGPIGVFDAVFGLPQFAVLQLHIWDKRFLGKWVWRVYAFTFLAWQLAYGFFIQPAVAGTSFNPGSLVGLAIQAPMLVAMFLYAFRRWPASAETAETAETVAKHRRAGLWAFAAASACLALVLLVPPAVSQFSSSASMSLRSLLYRPRIHEVEMPPPAQRPTVRLEGLSTSERAHLRGLLERGEYDALTRSFAEIEASAQKNPVNEIRAYEAYRIFSSTKYEERLDAWIANDPDRPAPYLARADHYYTMGSEARGTRSASETGYGQFRSMSRWYAKARADVDEALGLEPKLSYAYMVRIGIHNAEGEDAEEHDAFEEARRVFPRSYMLYATMLHCTLPRWGGSYEEMERIADRAIKENPADARFVALLGRVYADQAEGFRAYRRYDEALKLYGKAIAYGDAPGIYISRGKMYSQKGDLDAALADASHALELNPDSVEARLLRATVLLKKGDPRGAEREVSAAETITPGASEIDSWRAWAHEWGRSKQ